MMPNNNWEDVPKEVLDFLIQNPKHVIIDEDGLFCKSIHFREIKDIEKSILVDDSRDSVDCYWAEWGHYQVDVIILADTDNDEPALFWCPKEACFGVYDIGHSWIFLIINIDWQTLSSNAVHYINEASQGGDCSAGIDYYPWLRYPFKPTDSEILLEPIKSVCSFHGCPVENCHIEDLEGYEFSIDEYISSIRDEFLKARINSFPSTAVDTADGIDLGCQQCEKAKFNWVKRHINAVIPAEVRMHVPGRARCPKCNWNKYYKENRAFESFLCRCGALLNVLPALENKS